MVPEHCKSSTGKREGFTKDKHKMQRPKGKKKKIQRAALGKKQCWLLPSAFACLTPSAPRRFDRPASPGHTE